MGLQFILGSSGAGKTHWVYDTIIKESMVNTDTNYIILVPEQFTLQTQKDLVHMHPNKGIMNIDILSFMRLAYHVFDEVGGNNRLVLEDTGKSMIVKKVVMEKKNDLILFGANVKKQGFIDEMKSMISELLQYSIHSEELEKMREIAGDKKLLSNKINDIITIYSAYEDFLRDRYINAEEILDLLCEVIGKSEKIKDSVICLDGFTGFTPSQNKLLSYLLKYAKKVYVTVTLDAREENRYLKEHELFYLSYKTIEKLTKIADENGIEVLPNIFPNASDPVLYRYRNSKALAHLEHNIFRYAYKTFEEEQEDITITAAKTAKEEVKSAVIEICRLIREEGYRYKDIAIVTGDVEGYAQIIKRELAQVEIPCFVDLKKNILTNPLVELIRAVIEVVEHNFSYEGVMRFLKCMLVGVDHEELASLDNYVIAQGIRGISMYEREWTRTYRTNYEINLEQINQLRERIVSELRPLYDTLNKKDATVREKVTALYHLMVHYHCEEKLQKEADVFKSKPTDENMQRAKEYEQVYRLVIEIFDRIVELLGDDVLSIKEFKDILETGLKEAKVGLIPPGVDQILVGDIERTRLKDIKALFFVGVNDGVVPKANPGGGILSDMDRQLFADHAIELSPTKRQNAYTTEFYLYLNLTKPQNKLYLSFAKIDAMGKAMRTSYLIGKIQKLFPKIVTKNADVRTGNIDQDLDKILSTDEGFDYLIEQLRDYEEDVDNDLFYELYQLYLDGRLRARTPLSDILDGVFYQNKEKGLSAVVAKKLYAETLVGSVTRMERYAACAFAHFLEYGLNLEERKQYQVSVPDIGNIFHEALELFSKKLKASEYNWHNVPKEVEIALGKESVVEAVTDFGNGILESSKRNAYLIQRVERILLKTVEMLAKQLRAGKFEPFLYEQFFAHADRYLNLHGRIDRVDIYEDEKKLYLKVIDYKSGSTSFDLMSLYYGLQLQLGVYLSAAIELMKEKYPEKEIVPAGVFYYNLDDPIVEKSDHVEADIDKKLRMNGLANAAKEVVTLMDGKLLSPDGSLNKSTKSNVIPVETSKDGEFTKRSSVATLEQFQQLQRYITNLMHSFSVKIMEGDVYHNPYKNKNKEACSYCKFSSVCGFDCKIEGFKFRKLKSLANEDVWRLLTEEGDEEDGEHDVDGATEESN
ncbi:MAG: helicase-exonuclease AddAB subunit AddB [Clostridiales bacterium]|nr:helicase-exonuclease AddAB subunit AddB [Clostridiales bacterium]